MIGCARVINGIPYIAYEILLLLNSFLESKNFRLGYINVGNEYICVLPSRYIFDNYLKLIPYNFWVNLEGFEYSEAMQIDERLNVVFITEFGLVCLFPTAAIKIDSSPP